MANITTSRLDYSRIRNWISKAKASNSISTSEAEKLIKELESMNVVEPEEIPHDVVTMNSIVKITFMKTDRQVELKIVYPDQADPEANAISIFSPIATALIGYKVGDEIDWIVPSGPTTLRIDEILYQPEAAGDYTS